MFPKMKFKLPEHIESKFKDHVAKTYPEEATAIVINNELKIVDNKSLSSYSRFDIEWVDGMQAVLHSHPNSPPYVSWLDIKCQMANDVVYGVCSTWGDGVTDIYYYGDHLLDEDHNVDYLPSYFDTFSYARHFIWKNFGEKIEDTPRNVEYDYTEYFDTFFSKSENIIDGCAVLMSINSVYNNTIGVVKDGMIHFRQAGSRPESATIAKMRRCILEVYKVIND